MAPHQIVGIVGLILSAAFYASSWRIADLVGPRDSRRPGANIFRTMAAMFLYVFGPFIAVIAGLLFIIMALIP